MTAYLGILATLGIAVSAALPRTRLALTLLFGAWLLFALVLPRLASERSDDAHPLPSSQQVQQALLDRAPAYWTPESSAEHYRTLFTRYGVGRREDMPVDARGAELDLAERRSHRVFDQVLGGFYDQVERQDRAFARLAVISPAIAATAASATVTGGDFTQHRTFVDAAERYRRALVNRMNAAVTAHVHNHGGPRPVDDRRLWEQVPPFAYVSPRVDGGTARLVMPAIALALWAMLAWVLLIVSARRMRA